MKRIGSMSFAVVMAVLLAPSAWAVEVRPLEFIHALQEKDYNDVGIEYLKMIQASGAMPEELKDVWDLEMSKCLRGSATRAYDPKDFDNLMAETQKHLDKFLKEHPTHPQAVQATFSWGNFSMDKALQHLRAAQALTDKKQQAEQYAEARSALEDARPRFAKAIKEFEVRVKELPPAPKQLRTKEEKRQQAQRDRTEGEWLQARFQAALLDYYLSQTYPEKKDKNRVEVLKRASANFDLIYQTNRVDAAGQVNPIGLYAHMWHGRCADEMGNETLALDLYDEVLANSGDATGAASVAGMEPLFADVQYFRLQILARKNPREFEAEADRFCQENQRNKDMNTTDGYMGISLELAKMYLKYAEKASAPADRERYGRRARDLINNAARVRTAHQREAILLKRKMTQAAETDVSQITKADEALAVADTAATGGQWAEALKAYRRALELSANERDQTVVANIRERMAAARLMIARNLFAEGKLEECVKSAGELIVENENSPAAPSAAVIAIQAALNLYVTSKPADRPAALERLMKIANFTITKWPNKPEADEARLNLGKASLAQNEADKALEIFEKINPKSDRYPMALQLAGRTYWFRYLSERQKNAKAAGLEETRKKAVDMLATSVDLQKKAAEKEGAKGLSRDFMETAISLAEIRQDENNHEETAKLLQPLLDSLKGQKLESLDNVMLRLFIAAVNAYSTLGQLDKAGEVGNLLLDNGPDIAPVNMVLLKFVVTLDVERKKVAALVETGDDKAKPKLEAMNKMMAGMLTRLAEREQQTVQGMVYIADTLLAVGQKEAAKGLYGRLEEMAKDDAFRAQNAKAMTRVRTQLVSIFRREAEDALAANDRDKATKHYEEAYEAVTRLWKGNQRSLEPWMERGKILTSWANLEPSKYQAALDHWAQLRNMLSNMRGKIPPEVYDVTYNVAFCLIELGKRETDSAKAKEKWTQAEQLLKATLVEHSKLSGPDMVTKYNALIAEVGAKLGRPAAPPAAEEKKEEEKKQ